MPVMAATVCPASSSSPSCDSVNEKSAFSFSDRCWNTDKVSACCAWSKADTKKADRIRVVFLAMSRRFNIVVTKKRIFLEIQRERPQFLLVFLGFEC